MCSLGGLSVNRKVVVNNVLGPKEREKIKLLLEGTRALFRFLMRPKKTKIFYLCGDLKRQLYLLVCHCFGAYYLRPSVERSNNSWSPKEGTASRVLAAPVPAVRARAIRYACKS